MNTTQRLLVAYIELIAASKPSGAAYSGVTHACMVLDKVGADMADRATRSDSAEIYRTLGEVRAEVLRRAKAPAG